MLSKIKKGVTPSLEINNKNDKTLDGAHKYYVPPFFKETVNGTFANKVSATKTWNKTLWHYCNFHNHHNGTRCHKHNATDCKSRLRHVQSNASPPAANLAHDESPNKESSADQPVLNDDSNDITSFLASVLNMSGDNPELQEKITMALSAANLMWLLCHGLTEIAPDIYIYLIFTFPWPVLFPSFHGFFFVSSIASLSKGEGEIKSATTITMLLPSRPFEYYIETLIHFSPSPPPSIFLMTLPILHLWLSTR